MCTGRGRALAPRMRGPLAAGITNVAGSAVPGEAVSDVSRAAGAAAVVRPEPWGDTADGAQPTAPAPGATDLDGMAGISAATDGAGVVAEGLPDSPWLLRDAATAQPARRPPGLLAAAGAAIARGSRRAPREEVAATQ